VQTRSRKSVRLSQQSYSNRQSTSLEFTNLPQHLQAHTVWRPQPFTHRLSPRPCHLSPKFVTYSTLHCPQRDLLYARNKPAHPDKKIVYSKEQWSTRKLLADASRSDLASTIPKMSFKASLALGERFAVRGGLSHSGPGWHRHKEVPARAWLWRAARSSISGSNMCFCC
jgi:hypothetical protein